MSLAGRLRLRSWIAHLGRGRAERGLCRLALAPVLGALLFLGACPSTPPRDPRVSAAQYKLGNDYFARALRAKSDDERLRYANVALVELRKSLKADPENQEAHSLISLLYLWKAQKAIEETEVAQCLQGKEGEEYRKETDALMRRSLVHLQRAYSLKEEKDSRVALNLSTVSLYFKDYQATERFARKALGDIAYGTPHLARSNIGRAQFERGENHKALKNLKQAVFAEPRFCPGHYWLGRVEFAANKVESALQRFEAALACCLKEKIAPIQDAMLYQGLSLLRSGRKDEATAALEACLKQAPRSCVAERCKETLKTIKGSPR